MEFEEKFQKGFEEYERENSKYIEWLEGIREKNDEYFEVVQKIMPVFFEFSKHCQHKKTFLALLSFHTHLSTLKNGYGMKAGPKKFSCADNVSKIQRKQALFFALLQNTHRFFLLFLQAIQYTLNFLFRTPRILFEIFLQIP